MSHYVAARFLQGLAFGPGGAAVGSGVSPSSPQSSPPEWQCSGLQGARLGELHCPAVIKWHSAPTPSNT